MPVIPSNPINPTFNVIKQNFKQNLKYYLTIGDDSADLGSKIADAALSVVGSILMADFTGPFLTAFGLLNTDWSS